MIKTIITLIATAIFSFFAPIALTIYLLMGMIFLDTIVKLFSLNTVAKSQGRKYMDVFKSEILRKKFVLKSFGYMVLIIPTAMIDKNILTPSLEWYLELKHNMEVPVESLATNVLIVIFCFMELSSINENWNTLSGTNIFKLVSKTVKKIRGFIAEIVNIKRLLNEK